MALNKWIHPRNPYKTPPDFKQLAIKYPNFRKFVTQDLKGKIHLDFKNASALRCLTTTLLEKDFNLQVDLPENSLVPTLTLRLNYLLWIQDLLSSQKFPSKMSEKVTGLDIGTGASCIYPLLAAKHFTWRMIATEKDQSNYDFAIKNVTKNDLASEINIRKVENENSFMKGVINSEESLHFSMCNPPFFDEETKEDESDTDAAGTDNEMYTCGGEVKFVTNMALESKVMRDQVVIFTTMLGHKSSVAPVKKMLSSLGVSSLACTELCQGKTMRWAVAWTFTSGIDLVKVKGTKAKKEKTKHVLNWSVESGKHLPEQQQKATDLLKKIKEWLEEIEVDVAVTKETKHLCRARLTAARASWRGQRKKRRAEKKNREVKDLMANKCEVDEGLGTNASPCPGYAKFSEVEEEQSVQEDCHMSAAESFLLGEMGESASVTPPSYKESANHSSLKSSSSSDPQLVCDLVIRWVGPAVKVDMSFTSGPAGKEGMHQLLQFLKNKQSVNH